MVCESSSDVQAIEMIDLKREEKEKIRKKEESISRTTRSLLLYPSSATMDADIELGEKQQTIMDEAVELDDRRRKGWGVGGAGWKWQPSTAAGGEGGMWQEDGQRHQDIA